MNRKFLLNTSILIVLLTTAVFLSGCTTSNNEDNNEGENFSFTLLDETTKQLSDYRGKIIVLDLWATWCTPCQYQMLELQKAYEHYTTDQLEILSINTDARESISTIQTFLNQFAEYGYYFEWTFANELDDLSKYNPAESIPRLILFDETGTIYWEHNGLVFFSEFPEEWTGENILLKEKIDELIN